MKTTKNRWISLWLVVVLAVMPTGCSINPATGHIDAVTMSKSHEVKLGEKLHKAFTEKYPVYQDEQLSQYVSRVGQKLAAVSDRANIQYHFTVLDNPEINASALPGGYVYINRGLLAYLQDEAQLAAVLGHEIAHITARHSVRQQSAKTGRNIGAALTAIITGDVNVASAASQWGDAALAGYGREMELEADKFGASYMAKAGYDPQALIEVITLLKNHERFTKQLAKQKGIKKKSYHGVFSTHPRNDQRLLQAVSEAGEAETALSIKDTHRFTKDYQAATENLIWGNNYDLARQIAQGAGNRLISEPLQFSVLFPDEWAVQLHQFSGLSASDTSTQAANNTTQQTSKGNGWVASESSSQARIALIPLAIPTNLTPLTILKQGIKPAIPQESEAFVTAQGLKGHTAKVTRDGIEKRVAVIRRGNSVFWIEGYQGSDSLTKELDEYTLITAKSFQHLPPKSKQKRSKTIHYVTANQHTTFARLAKSLKLAAEGESYLRLINGYYPRGEPYSGEVIKIIR